MPRKKDNRGKHRVKKYEGKDLLVMNMNSVVEDLILGVPIVQICKKYGVSRQTWYNLYKTNENFRKVVDSVEELQAMEIKNNLIAKCHDRYVIREKVLSNGRKVKYREFVSADFNAIKFYLLNKLPNEFKDKQEVTINDTRIDVTIDGVDFEVSDVIDDVNTVNTPETNSDVVADNTETDLLPEDMNIEIDPDELVEFDYNSKTVESIPAFEVEFEELDDEGVSFDFEED